MGQMANGQWEQFKCIYGIGIRQEARYYYIAIVVLFIAIAVFLKFEALLE